MGTSSRAAQRPRSLIILASLLVLQALILASYGIYRGVYSSWYIPAFADDTATVLLWVSEVFTSAPILILQGVVLFLSALGLLRLSQNAWLVAMSIQGLDLLMALFAYHFHKPNYLAMLAGVFLVFYLNQVEIQAVLIKKREAR